MREQLGVIAGRPGRQSVKVEAMLRDAAEDLSAFTSFPTAHWKKMVHVRSKAVRGLRPSS
jgi:putative transposase